MLLLCVSKNDCIFVVQKIFKKMAEKSKIVGRQKEVALLREIVESPRPEFVAVYGRRRIGCDLLKNSYLC